MNEELIFKARVDIGGSLGEFKKLQREFIETRKLELELRDTLKEYRAELKRVANDPALGKQSKEYQDLTEKVIRTEQSLKQTRTTQRNLNKEFDRLKLPVDSTARMRKEVNKLQGELEKHVRGVTITAKEYDRLERQVREGRAELIKFGNRVNDGRANVGRYAQSLKGLTGSLGGLKTAIGTAFAVSAITEFGQESFSVFTTFRRQIQILGAISQASSEDLGRLEENARELGRTTQFTASQVASLQIEYARLGFGPSEILKQTADSLNLASVAQSELSQTAEVLGGTIKAYGLDASEAQRVTDVLGLAFSSSALDISKFETILGLVGATASTAGVSLETTAALTGILVDRKVDASTAGTGLRNIFLDLAASGLSFEDAMDKINNSSNKNATSLELFGKRGATIGLILAENEGQVTALNEKLNDSAGFAKQAGDALTDDLQGDVDLFSSALEGLRIRIVGTFEGALRTSVRAGAAALGTIGDIFEFVVRKSQPLVDAFGRLSEAIFGTSNAGEVLEPITRLLSGALTVLVNVLATVVNGVSDVVDFFFRAAESNNVFGKALRGVIELINQTRIVISFLPAVLNGFIEGAKQAAINISASFQQVLLEGQLLFTRLSNLVGQATDEQVRQLVESREKLKSASKSVAQAATDGFNDALDFGSGTAGAIEDAAPEANAAAREAGKNAGTNFGNEFKKEVDSNIFTALKNQIKGLNDELKNAQSAKDYAAILNQILDIEDQITGIGRDIVGEAMGDQSTIDLNTLQGAGSDTGTIDGLSNQATGILQIDPQEDPEFLRQQALEEAVTEQAAKFQELRRNQEKQDREQRLKELEQFEIQRGSVIQAGILEFGKITSEFLNGEQENLKEFLKSVTVAALDTLEKIVNIKLAESKVIALASADSVATFGISGLAKAAVIGALIKGAFALVKGQIGKLEKGGVIKLGVPEGGRSHAQGGNKKIIGGQAIETERGEVFDVDETGSLAVINKISSRLFGSELKQIAGLRFPGKRALLSGINSFKGFGVSFPKAANGALIPSFPQSFTVPRFSPPNTTTMQNGGLVAGGNITTDPDNSELRKLLAENNQLMREQINATKELMPEDIPEQSTQRTF